MAILGSKGSGKKALLDVIACQTENTTRGQVLLNGSTLTKSVFQQKCGYVSHSVDFIHGLTVSQTLHYTPTVVSNYFYYGIVLCVICFILPYSMNQFNGYSKGSKVRQILADLALSQVSNKRVEYLNLSEKRRLAIGVQLVRECVMVLLDEPTHQLDPLDAYLLVSILSNYAKKTGCGILLSMEKPRSDVFPFLDRALFLCLGGVVYSGSTRGMLEYFHSIGFPCPQVFNYFCFVLLFELK